MNEKLAKALRILTLPPVLVLVLILLLRSQYPPLHAAIAVLTLAVFPLLAYLVWRCVPTLHRHHLTPVGHGVGGTFVGTLHAARARRPVDGRHLVVHHLDGLGDGTVLLAVAALVRPNAPVGVDPHLPVEVDRLQSEVQQQKKRGQYATQGVQ